MLDLLARGEWEDNMREVFHQARPIFKLLQRAICRHEKAQVQALKDAEKEQVQQKKAQKQEEHRRRAKEEKAAKRQERDATREAKAAAAAEEKQRKAAEREKKCAATAAQQQAEKDRKTVEKEKKQAAQQETRKRPAPRAIGRHVLPVQSEFADANNGHMAAETATDAPRALRRNPRREPAVAR